MSWHPVMRMTFSHQDPDDSGYHQSWEISAHRAPAWTPGLFCSILSLAPRALPSSEHFIHASYYGKRHR